MHFRGIQHVSIPVKDFTRARHFYCDVLGLEPHPEKSNWLGIGQGCPVHLMEQTIAPAELPHEPARHFALQVSRLEDVVALLLRNGFKPFQSDVQQRKHCPVRSIEQPLDFGIGTIFVEDPDDNIVEFIEMGRGIFAEYDPS
ncbi:VOC family protein [Mesorhizobium sp. M0152]|uniref:VOC family protein n=1 Tax=Mesorhizobium sp. M0152 TaxID=2956898 RepID=UPI00333BA45E